MDTSDEMLMSDEEIDEIMKKKCSPIIGLIDKEILFAEEKRINPKYVVLSPFAYLALHFSLGRVTEEVLSGNPDRQRYKGLEIIVDHAADKFCVRVLGSIKDEVCHPESLRVSLKDALSVMSYKGWGFKPADLNVYNACSQLMPLLKKNKLDKL